ncbi:MAG: VanZ family protein [Chloroflexi bacterium]|nr:VanZ family protein [Chloroflexota bacterium]
MLTSLMHPAQRGARLCVLVGWMALISYWSGQGTLPIDQPQVVYALHGLQHRLAHLVAFSLLALLARWAFDGLPRAAFWAVLLTSAFGATDEWHQSFTPGRRAALDDWALDTAFAAGGLVLWARWRAINWQTPMRAAAPLAVASIFAVGIALAVWPNVPLARDRPSLRAVPSQVAHTARDVARSTRDLARQFRSSVAG